jgi:putative transposase
MGNLPIAAVNHPLTTLRHPLGMTNYRRMRVPGGTYFFTVCLEDRVSTALTDHIDRLRFAYAKTVAELPVTCDAMVVLPNHLHAVWTLPEGDSDFSERWRRLKARFSHGLSADLPPCRSKLEKRERGLWQRRFWEHVVRNEENLQAAIEFCRQNPVKHGLVSDASEWRFSSFYRKARKDRNDGQNCPSYLAVL